MNINRALTHYDGQGMLNQIEKLNNKASKPANSSDEVVASNSTAGNIFKISANTLASELNTRRPSLLKAEVAPFRTNKNRPLPPVPSDVAPFRTNKNRPLPSVPSDVAPFRTNKNRPLPSAPSDAVAPNSNKNSSALSEPIQLEANKTEDLAIEKKPSKWKIVGQKMRNFFVAFFRTIKRLFENVFGRLFGRVKRIRIGKNTIQFEDNSPKKAKGPIESETTFTVPMTDDQTRFMRGLAATGNYFVETLSDGSQIIIPNAPNYPPPEPPTEAPPQEAGEASEITIPPAPDYPPPPPPTGVASRGIGEIPPPPPLLEKRIGGKWVRSSGLPVKEKPTTVVKDVVGRKKAKQADDIFQTLAAGLLGQRAKLHYDTDSDSESSPGTESFLEVDFEKEDDNTETTLSFRENGLNVNQKKRQINNSPLARKIDPNVKVEELNCNTITAAMQRLRHEEAPHKEKKSQKENVLFNSFVNAFNSMYKDDSNPLDPFLSDEISSDSDWD